MTRFQKNLENTMMWRDVIDYHWHRLQGVMNNDQEFWDDTLHAMTDSDWWAWCDIEPALAIEHEELYRKRPKLKEDTEWIRHQLMLGKPVTRPMGKGKNFTAFRTLMNIHDLVNDILGTPTKQYPKATEGTTDATEQRYQHFQGLFDVDA
jgi:hypothetical protein